LDKTKKMKNKIILLFAISIWASVAWAQDELLDMLEDKSLKNAPVIATYKSTRIVNLHSNEQMKAKHLDFRIQHRFGPVDISESNQYGFYNMFGLDGAVIRLGFEYGVTDKLMIGAGRSTVDKAYDGFVKYKVLQQSKKMPISINYFGNAAINTIAWPDRTREYPFSARWSFVNQLIISKKFNDFISATLAPTVVHHNLVSQRSEPNTNYAVGIGTSIRITPSIRFNAEFIPRLNGRNEPNGNPYYDAFAFGLDFETGGHVFQLHFTNARGLIEQQFITRNINPLTINEPRFGFNLSRTFSFDKQQKW
jgi:hypothetical protein